jgi:hypothetical protein
MKKTIMAVLMTIGAILTVVGSIFWISQFFGSDAAPELATSFFRVGAWLLLASIFLIWTKEKR